MAVPAMRVRLALLLVLTGGALLWSGSAEAAAPPWAQAGLARGTNGAYTTNSCGSDRKIVDPYNVVWYGDGATAVKVAHRLYVMGWSRDDKQSPYGYGEQYARYRRSGCGPSNATRANRCAICERDHVRIFDTKYTRASGDVVRHVVGDAHHDHLSYAGGCQSAGLPVGHVARFNQGRDQLVHDYVTEYPNSKLRVVDWGNTKMIRQCDGHRVGASGLVYYFKVPGASAASAENHPLNVTRPSVSGTYVAGQPLTATSGTWSNGTTSVTYQWCVVNQQDDDKCDNIAGAQSATWTPTTDFVGRSVAVRVRPVGVNRESDVLSAVREVLPPQTNLPALSMGEIEGNYFPVTVRPNGSETVVQTAAYCNTGNPPTGCSFFGSTTVDASETEVQLMLWSPILCGPGDAWVRATNAAGTVWAGPRTDPNFCT